MVGHESILDLNLECEYWHLYHLIADSMIMHLYSN